MLIDVANWIVEWPDEDEQRVVEAVRDYLERKGPTATRERWGQVALDTAIVADAQAQAAHNAAVVRAALDNIPRLSDGTGSATLGYLRVSVAIERNAAGKVHVRLGSPLVGVDQLRLLESSEAKRFARCHVCNRYFYATRLVAGKPPAGCAEHGSAARQARYRRSKAKD
jgi:hypothetical protein